MTFTRSSNAVRFLFVLVALCALVGSGQAQDADKAAKLAELKQQFDAQKGQPYTQRTTVLSQIGSLGTDAAAAFLAGVAGDAAEDRYVRRYALSNCGRCKSKAQLPLLTRMADDADPYVASGAIDGLGNYDKADAPLDVLERAASDPDVSKSNAAVSALVRIKPDDLDARLRRLADQVQAPMAGATIVDHMARAKHPDTVKVVEKFLAEWPANQDMYRGRLIGALKTLGMTVETMELALAQLDGEQSGMQVRKAVREAMESVEAGPVLDWLVENGLGHKDPEVRTLVAGAVGKTPSDKAATALAEQLKGESDPVVQVALIDALVDQGPAACDAAFDSLEKLMDSREEALAVAAIHALGHCRGHADDRAMIGKLRRIAKSNRAGNAQGEALVALARLGDDETLDLIQKGLKSRDWRTAAAAVQAARVLRAIEVIELLIAALDKAEGRLRGDITLALQDLTGKSLPDDAQVWGTWWRANRQGFVIAPPINQRAEDNAQVQGATGFYGMEVRSHRVCFILDVSGSMSAKSTFVPTNMPAQTTTRLDVAKHQLKQVIDQFAKMDAKVKFNIIFFHSNPEPWQERLVETNDRSIADARAYVEKQTPRGGTNIFDTLEVAMQDPDVDTIYMLTDGSPGSGKYVAADDICREIRRLNRTRRIVINTIGIQVNGAPKEFLTRLAEENGGQFVNR